MELILYIYEFNAIENIFLLIVTNQDKHKQIKRDETNSKYSITEAYKNMLNII